MSAATYDTLQQLHFNFQPNTVNYSADSKLYKQRCRQGDIEGALPPFGKQLFFIEKIQ